MFNQSLLKSEVLHPLLAAGCPQILLFTFWIIFALLWREVLIGKVPKIVLARYTGNKCILRKNGLRKEDSDSPGRKGNKHWKLLSLSCIISLSYNNQIKTEQKKSPPANYSHISLQKSSRVVSPCYFTASNSLLPFLFNLHLMGFHHPSHQWKCSYLWRLPEPPTVQSKGQFSVL